MSDIQVDQKDITSAITKMEEAITILKQCLEGIETIERRVVELTKYQSGSGNTTWKGDCEDGTRVYFRQSQKSMYEGIQIWDELNAMEWDIPTSVSIDIETAPDGDFQKIMSINAARFY